MQYVDKLCRLGILNHIKTNLLHKSTLVREKAVLLLSFIIPQYASSPKPFQKVQQFENEIRQSLLHADFISLLIKLAVDKTSTLSIRKSVFICFCEFTTSISISNDDCLHFLLTANSCLLTSVCSMYQYHLSCSKIVCSIVQSSKQSVLTLLFQTA